MQLSLPAVTSNCVLPEAYECLLHVLCAVQIDGPIPRPEDPPIIYICVCVCDQAVQRPLQLQRAGRRGQTDKERNKEHDVKLCSETEKCREKFVNNERLTVNKEMEYIYVYTYIYIYIFNVVLTVHRR